MWDLPGPGLEPVSPALAGGFLTTVPPGKSKRFIFNISFQVHCVINLNTTIFCASVNIEEYEGRLFLRFLKEAY